MGQKSHTRVVVQPKIDHEKKVKEQKAAATSQWLQIVV
jgi:hypothetical protein